VEEGLGDWALTSFRFFGGGSAADDMIGVSPEQIDGPVLSCPVLCRVHKFVEFMPRNRSNFKIGEF
jgi:hypothetical protein